MDSPERKTPQDLSRINLTDEGEIRYWMRQLKVSEAMLRDAVNKSGHGAGAVRWYLQQPRQRQSSPPEGDD